MRGFHFSKFDPNENSRTKFEQLLDLFMQLLTYTNGDVAEALDWMNQLDRQYELTNEEYGMGAVGGAKRHAEIADALAIIVS